jgi:transcription initiation factor TFIID subunit 10
MVEVPAVNNMPSSAVAGQVTTSPAQQQPQQTQQPQQPAPPQATTGTTVTGANSSANAQPVRQAEQQQQQQQNAMNTTTPAQDNDHQMESIASGPVSATAAAVADVAAADDNDPRSLLTSVADYEPSIPDAVTRYFLSKAGCSLADPELAKVVSLAAQLFVGELAAEVHDSVEIRAHSKASGGAMSASAKKKEAMENNGGTKMLASDLAAVLRRRGLNIQKPDFQVP